MQGNTCLADVATGYPFYSRPGRANAAPIRFSGKDTLWSLTQRCSKLVRQGISYCGSSVFRFRFCCLSSYCGAAR